MERKNRKGINRHEKVKDAETYVSDVRYERHRQGEDGEGRGVTERIQRQFKGGHMLLTASIREMKMTTRGVIR